MQSNMHYTIGSVRFSSLTDNDIITTIDETIELKNRITIAHANAHFVVEAKDNPKFGKYLEKYHLVQPDGVGVYWAAKMLGIEKNSEPDLQTGTDFYYLLLHYADKKKKKIFFLGTTENVLESLISIVRKKYPDIVLAGYHNGYFDASDDSIVKEINGVAPDILMIGMGVPRQEYWLQENFQQLCVPVCITVGAGLDFLSTVKQRAPQLFRMFGLEWFFRLLQEPKRLWKRYVLGIPKFIYIVLKQKLSG